MDLENAGLAKANLSRLCLRGARLSNCNLAEALLDHADLESAKLTKCNLSQATFDHANLKHADLTAASMGSASLASADLTDAVFERAVIHDTKFNSATLDRANFEFASLSNPSLHEALLRDTRGLWGRRKAKLSSTLESGAEFARFGHDRDYVPWDKIKLFGSLPLFGASYGTIIIILIATGLLRWYNDAAAKIREFANSLEVSHWGAHVPTLEPPQRFATLMVSILLIAFASTYYRLRCPSIVSEYSETRWYRELEKPLIEYKAASYSDRLGRHVCAGCYILGSLYTLCYLAARILGTLHYLISVWIGGA